MSSHLKRKVSALRQLSASGLGSRESPDKFYTHKYIHIGQIGSNTYIQILNAIYMVIQDTYMVIQDILYTYIYFDRYQ